MYNRYHGNSGRVERVEEPSAETRRSTGQSLPRSAPPAAAGREARTPSPLSGLSGELGKLLGRVSGRGLETEDLLLLLILLLLYRESGDEEFLLAAGGLLLC